MRIANQLSHGSPERLDSETIWSNGKFFIPMCGVQHIERRTTRQWSEKPVTRNSHQVTVNGIVVVMKSTRLDATGDWDNGIWLWGDDSEKFIADYCIFRNEIDPIMQGPGPLEG